MKRKILIIIIFLIAVMNIMMVAQYCHLYNIQEQTVKINNKIYNGGGNRSESQEMQILKLVNEAREKEGLQPLKYNDKVAAVAQLRADEMNKNKYFEHERPNHTSWVTAYQELGVDYTIAAENIARGFSQPETVVAAWMASEGHRKNILNPRIEYMGIGISGYYYAQEFIKP